MFKRDKSITGGEWFHITKEMIDATFRQQAWARRPELGKRADSNYRAECQQTHSLNDPPKNNHRSELTHRLHKPLTGIEKGKFHILPHFLTTPLNQSPHPHCLLADSLSLVVLPAAPLLCSLQTSVSLVLLWVNSFPTCAAGLPPPDRMAPKMWHSIEIQKLVFWRLLHT